MPKKKWDGEIDIRPGAYYEFEKNRLLLGIFGTNFRQRLDLSCALWKWLFGFPTELSLFATGSQNDFLAHPNKRRTHH